MDARTPRAINSIKREWDRVVVFIVFQSDAFKARLDHVCDGLLSTHLSLVNNTGSKRFGFESFWTMLNYDSIVPKRTSGKIKQELSDDHRPPNQ